MLGIFKRLATGQLKKGWPHGAHEAWSLNNQQGSVRIPGQVPGRAPPTQAQKLHPELENSLNKKPGDWSIERFFGKPVINARVVVSGLGLPPTVEDALEGYVAAEVDKADNAVRLKQALYAKLLSESYPKEVRAIVTSRAVQLMQYQLRKAGRSEIYQPEDLAELQASQRERAPESAALTIPLRKAANGTDATNRSCRGTNRSEPFQKSETEWHAIPEELAFALIRQLPNALQKGAGHKYIRRVPTGKPKPKYRYFYAVTGGQGLGHGDELKAGAAFKVAHGDKQGHYHIQSVDGDTVRIKHDETGRFAIMSRKALTAMLHKEHATVIGKTRTKLNQDLKDVAKYGSAKQKASLTARAEKFHVLHGGIESPEAEKQVDTKPAKSEDTGMEKKAPPTTGEHFEGKAYDAADVIAGKAPYKVGDVLSPAHNSEKTAYVIDDYPYGSMRTEMRVWLDTNKKGEQRVMRQTQNPKTGHWNKPKASTYSDAMVLTMDEKGHVKGDGWSLQWSGSEASARWLNDYGHVLTATQKSRIKFRVDYNANMKAAGDPQYGTAEHKEAHSKAMKAALESSGQGKAMVAGAKKAEAEKKTAAAKTKATKAKGVTGEAPTLPAKTWSLETVAKLTPEQIQNTNYFDRLRLKGTYAKAKKQAKDAGHHKLATQYAHASSAMMNIYQGNKALGRLQAHVTKHGHSPDTAKKSDGTDELAKGETRGGKYYKRTTDDKGAHRYFYDKADYDKSANKHVDGEEAQDSYVGKAALDMVAKAGKGGCDMKEFTSLVKRHGAKCVNKACQGMVKAGKAKYTKGRFYAQGEAEDKDKGTSPKKQTLPTKKNPVQKKEETKAQKSMTFVIRE